MLLNKTLASVLAVATLGVVTLTATKAQAFTFRDDPNSGFNDILSTIELDDQNNTRTIRNLRARNFSDTTIPQLSFLTPWVWPKQKDNTFVNMTWRNDLNGWYTDNYEDTNLLIKLDKFFLEGVPGTIGKLRIGDVADNTGKAQLPLTQPCNHNSPSCYGDLSSSFPLQTRNLDDKIPVLDLGSFLPNEIKSFDVVFKYEFGDNRRLPEYIEPQLYSYTVSPIAKPVPEPTATTPLFVAAIGLGVLRLNCYRKRKQQIKLAAH